MEIACTAKNLKNSKNKNDSSQSTAEGKVLQNNSKPVMPQNQDNSIKDLTSCIVAQHDESDNSTKEPNCLNKNGINLQSTKNVVLNKVIFGNDSNTTSSLNPLRTNNPDVLSVEAPKPASSLRKTADLLDVLQKALASSSAESPATNSSNVLSSAKTTISSKLFKIRLDINSATNLPRNKKKGSKRVTGAKCKQSRSPPNEEPSTYVTFQVDAGFGPMIKSHEGMVYATNVFEKSSNPIWNMSYDIAILTDFLINSQKRFILKIWKKSTMDLGHSKLLPTPLEDSIIGFSAIDLTVLLKGMIYGWFNIVDFSGRLNGQIKVKVQSLDNIDKIKIPTTSADMLSQPTFPCEDANILNDIGPNTNIDLNNTQLSRAIKRKFNELEEITQRLRARLLDVTGDAETFSEMTDVDELQLDEFERDLNTSCFEEDAKVDWFKRAPSTSDFINQSERTATNASISDETVNTPEKIHLISEFLERTEITEGFSKHDVELETVNSQHCNGKNQCSKNN